MDLVINNLKEGTSHTYQKNVGRCLQRIPNSEKISFVTKEENKNVIKAIHPINGKIDSITTIWDIEDYAWHPLGFAVAGTNNRLLIFDSTEKKPWAKLHTFKDKNIQNISRIAISPKGDKIAIVSETSPEKIIDKQFKSFNKRDLDAFVSCFSKDIIVSNFPNNTISKGIENLRKGYQNYFDKDSTTQVKVVSRIHVGNTIIDKEITKKGEQAAIYQIQNSKIKTMTFVYGKGDKKQAEQVVANQLKAYNSRDIDAFINTYSKNIEVHKFLEGIDYSGQEKLRTSYEQFFKSTPDLNCQVINRIVLGNIVIDQESITADGRKFNAIAIYEVEKDKIVKITFIP